MSENNLKTSLLNIIDEYRSLRLFQNTMLQKAGDKTLSDRRKRESLKSAIEIAGKLDDMIGIDIHDIRFELSGHMLEIYNRLTERQNCVVNLDDIPNSKQYVSTLRTKYDLEIESIRGKGYVLVKS